MDVLDYQSKMPVRRSRWATAAMWSATVGGTSSAAAMFVYASTHFGAWLEQFIGRLFIGHSYRGGILILFSCIPLILTLILGIGALWRIGTSRGQLKGVWMAITAIVIALLLAMFAFVLPVLVWVAGMAGPHIGK